MIRAAVAALVFACTWPALVRADGSGSEARADAAFRAAGARAASGDAGAVDAFEQLGAALPVTRWSDDAWLEAGRLAERAGDYARARRDLERALELAGDDQLARRARAELAVVARAAGGGAEWSAIAGEHDRLERRIRSGGGDPEPAVKQLEALVEAHPGYPRAALAMVLIAQVWQREGDSARALAWLRRAPAAAASAGAGDRTYVRAELARALVYAGELDEARTEIGNIAAPAVAAELGRELARAERRRQTRWAVWGLLAVLAGVAVIALRRAAGTWRAAGRRLVRPPIEVLYLAPIALVLVVVAATGNPLVARAVRAIAICGVVVAWVSGAILELVRARQGRVRLARAAAHAALAALAVGAATYLAVDRDRMIDLVVETMRSGPQER